MPETFAISPAFREQLRCQLAPALELVSAALQPDRAVACKLLLAARVQLKALSAVPSVEQRPGVLPFTRVRRRQLCEQACDELVASARAYFDANDAVLDVANTLLAWLGGRPIYGRLPVDEDVCAGLDPAD